jgi:hypothetical protein
MRAGGTPAAEAVTAESPVGGTGAVAARGAEINAAKAQPGDAGGDAQLADASGDGAAALTEALRLLGIDAGGQTLRARLSKVAPIAAAQAAEAHRPDTKMDTKSAETQVADAASGGVRAAGTTSEGAVALTEAMHLLGIDAGAGGQTPRVRLAKTAPASLNALISKVADIR